MILQVRLPNYTRERTGDIIPCPATPVMQATFSEPEEPIVYATELPPWEEIVASANQFVKAAGEGLSAAAREFNVTGKIQDLESTFHDILATSAVIRGHMSELTQQGVTLDQLSDELGVVFNDIEVYLKNTFPPPDQAPSHEERQEMVTTVLDKAEQGLLDLARKRGMSEDGLERVRESFSLLKPRIEKLVVITGAALSAVCIAVSI